MNSRRIMINACVILILGLLSIDLYNPALPSIKIALNITDAQAQRMVVWYLGGFSVSQLIYGPMSDKYGRVPVILLSLFLAALGNYLTSTAESYHALLAFRLFTGLGAGGCPVISRAILSDTFKDKAELSKSLTVFSMASQISPALAPIIGGYITAHLPWKYNFLALALFMCLGFLFVKITLRETVPKRRVSQGAFSGFIVLLSSRKFVIYSLVSAILFAITIGYFTASPFVFQRQFNLSPQQNGYVFIAYSAGIVTGSWLTKRGLTWVTPEKLLRVSLPLLVIVTLSAFLATQSTSLLSVGFIVTYSAAVGLGCGLSSPLLLGISLHGHPGLAGTGSALQGTLKMAGAALVLWFFAGGHTATASGLLLALFILSLMCFALITLPLSNRE